MHETLYVGKLKWLIFKCMDVEYVKRWNVFQMCYTHLKFSIQEQIYEKHKNSQMNVVN